MEYEVLRRNLDFDMGTMQLDEMYEWSDPGYIDGSIGTIAAAREGVAENDANCCGMFTQEIPMGSLEPQFVNEGTVWNGGDDETTLDPPPEPTSTSEDVYELEFEPPADPQPVKDLMPELPVEQVPVPQPPVLDKPLPSDDGLLLKVNSQQKADVVQSSTGPLKPLLRIADRRVEVFTESARRTKLSADPAFLIRDSSGEFDALIKSKKLRDAFRPPEKLDFNPLPAFNPKADSQPVLEPIE